MTRRTQWSAALLLGGLSLAGLITASVAVSQEQKPAAVDPAGLPSIPGAPGTPLGIRGVVFPPTPDTPTPPVGGTPALPPATTPAPGGGSGFLAIDPAPVAPSGAGNATGAPSPGSNEFRGMRDTSTLQVISLKNANQQTVREIIETLMPAARGSVVVDARTNTLIVRVPQETYGEIEQLVKVLDIEAPAPKGAEPGATMTVLDKPGTKPSRGTGGTGAYYVGFTGNSAAELRHEYEKHDHAARELAEAIKRGSGTPALRLELRERVADAFVARQKLLRFELAELQRRMKTSQESIDLRDRVANQIVERRINDLLDPNLQWEPAPGLLSGTGGMKGIGPTSANRPADSDMFRETSDGAPPGRRPPTALEPTPDPASRKRGSANPPPATTRSVESPFEQSYEDDMFAPPARSRGTLDSPPLRAPTPVPQPRVNPSDGLGTLRGRVIFDGAFTAPPPLYKKGAVPKDTSICGAEDIPDERILVGNGGGLANVFVYLEKAPAGTTPPPVAGPLILDQSGCIFQPRALIVRTEQVIQAFNSDPIAHNVHTYPIKSAALNMVLGPNDKTGVAIKYPLPEKQPFAVGCDIHPWMQAYHLPLDHSFGAVTDANGEFEIDALPAGTHKFKVWHEAGKMLERNLEVTIKPGDNDAQIRVNAGQLNIQPAAPGGGGPMPKPAGKGFSAINEGSLAPRKEKLEENGGTSTTIGTLRGRVIVEGQLTPLSPLFDKGGAPKDTSVCGIEAMPDQRILVSKGGGLANVFVYLEKVPFGTTPPPVTDPIIVDQKGCVFGPRAIVLRTGQTIQFLNDDPIHHNVHSFPKRSTPFNVVLQPRDQVGIALKHNQAEKEPIGIGCDLHSWMQAYHLPLDHGFAAVTNAEGEFEIKGLPTGTHEFKVWHEVGKTLEQALDVKIKSGDNDIRIGVTAEHLFTALPRVFDKFSSPIPAARTEPASIDAEDGDGFKTQEAGLNKKLSDQ